MQKTSFLFLYIYILFSAKGICQDLNLKINGFNKEETSIIDSLGYKTKHKDFSSINSEIKSFQNKLFNIGYIENEITDSQKINDSNFGYQIQLKNKYESLTIYYSKTDIDSETLQLISDRVFEDYFIINFPEIDNALQFINSEISKKGLPFSKLKLSNITTNNNTTSISANLTIETTNKQRTVNQIIIKGYEKFPKSYLKHFLKLKTNQVFNLSTIKAKTLQLNNLNFASEIKSPEVLFSKESTKLYLYLNKLKSNAFDGFLGFGTNEESKNIEFDGYLNLNLTNNLNFGESFKLLYKSDENDQKTLETQLTLPYIFNSPIGIDLLLRIFKKDSSFTTVNQSINLHYQINAKHKIYTGIINTESNNLQSTVNNTLIQDYNTTQYKFGYQYLKQQGSNLLFPVKSKLELESSLGNRKSSTTTEKQTQITIDAFNIFNLNNKNSIYLRINGSNLISDSYFENELLRFGGINSIRGFEENSLFSTLFAITNTEYRLQLSNSIFVHSIIDAGYFENTILNTREKLYGYGFGFGILTKSGLFRLNYANGKNENTKFKLSNSKIHISLTAYF